MKIVSFNVNGVRARVHQIDEVFRRYRPDVLAIQETKVVDELFPVELFTEAGYHIEFFGQKGHYGVALASLAAPEEVFRGFPGDAPDAQRRFIGARYVTPSGRSLYLGNGYFPQGECRAHAVKFPAKERFYADLTAFLRSRFSAEDPVVLVGDMNVAPLDFDVGIGEQNAKRWLRTGKCCFLPEERAWLQRIQDWGMVDTYRRVFPERSDQFSWFDYRTRGFEDDPRRGLRIDLILATAGLADRILGAGIDEDMRGMEKPSDHCPVWVDLDW